MTTIALPPAQTIEQALYDLSEHARLSGDESAMKAFDNAAGDFARGLVPHLSADCWLVASSTRPNLYHRVRKEGGAWGCNCEQGRTRGGMCRHRAMIEAIDSAWDGISDPVADLHQALDATEAVLWPDGDAPLDTEAEARQRRYEQAEREMLELYA